MHDLEKLEKREKKRNETCFKSLKFAFAVFALGPDMWIEAEVISLCNVVLFGW